MPRNYGDGGLLSHQGSSGTLQGMKPLLERVLSRFRITLATGCWEWEGTRWQSGYGQIQEAGRKKRAHRVVYEALVQTIPEGLQLDHLCRVRHCVNPEHLELVTCRENILRGTGSSAAYARRAACAHGHLFTPENTYHHPSGKRVCRRCRQATDRLRYQMHGNRGRRRGPRPPAAKLQ